MSVFVLVTFISVFVQSLPVALALHNMMLVSVLLWALLAPGHSIAFNNFNNRAELRAAVVAWEKDVTERCGTIRVGGRCATSSWSCLQFLHMAWSNKGFIAPR